MALKQTVLIAEDNEVNLITLTKILSAEYEILQARNGQEALELLLLKGTSISGIILDLIMPVMDGFGFLRAVRDIEEYKNIPIIVATGNSGNESEAIALELGAWDFISKPYNAKAIRFRLRNAIERSQLAAFNQIKYLAEFDTLTGIYNKSKFFQNTREMLNVHKDKRFVFVRFDIDRFQLINSFFGTEEGDRLLCYLADNLRENATQELYTYGRIEGDVFAFCFAYPSREIVMNKLALAVDKVKSYNRSFNIVPAYGVYFLDDATDLPISEILDRATLAVKIYKGKFMDTIAVYTTEMSRKLEQDQEIINEMNSALEEKQFCIYLQPKFSLETNTPCGAEALVRWNHPVKGMLPPADFIPVFEKNGFISKLDYYVWETVCSLLKSWIDEGKSPYPISVNVSRVNLYNPQIVDLIFDLTQKHDIPPHLLQLELTESAYMDNPQVMKRAVKSLHEKGFTILMDDFGSGYSSLSVLKDIEVDSLKIDMRFFGESEIAGRGENIIASVVRLAKWLSIPAIAEGAERSDQISFLRSVGCEYVQGYYFAKPMPIEEYEKLAADNCAVESNAQATASLNIDSLWSSGPEMDILFSNATQASCMYEFDGSRIDIIRVNEAYNKLFGYSDKAMGENPLNQICFEHKAMVLNGFQNCVSSQRQSECEFRRKTAAGDSLWINLKLQYICQVGLKHICLGNLSDITVQKNVEFELSSLKSAMSKIDRHLNKMLIVDDSSVSREMLCLIFKDEFELLTAEGGAEGLMLLEKNKENIAIILLDMIMPGVNGEEFLRCKNEMTGASDIPVVIISSEYSANAQINMLKLGVQDYITKPFIDEAVARRVKNALEYNARLRAYAKEGKDAAATVLKQDQPTESKN